MTRKYATLYERLVANTAEPESSTGCWIWAGATDGRRGAQYPRVNMRIDGQHRCLKAHRVMAQIFAEETLPPTAEVDHVCGETLCINPDHLDVTTKRANLDRRNTRQGWGRPS